MSCVSTPLMPADQERCANVIARIEDLRSTKKSDQQHSPQSGSPNPHGTDPHECQLKRTTSFSEHRLDDLERVQDSNATGTHQCRLWRDTEKSRFAAAETLDVLHSSHISVSRLKRRSTKLHGDGTLDDSACDEIWDLIKRIDPYAVEITVEHWIEAKMSAAQRDGVSFSYFIDELHRRSIQGA